MGNLEILIETWRFGSRYEMYMQTEYSTTEIKVDSGYVFNTNGKKTQDICGSGTGSLNLVELEVYAVN